MSDATTLKNIKILSLVDGSLLYEGPSNKAKKDIIIEYGNKINILYQQQYTTVCGNQTYDEALNDEANHHYTCYTKDEFIEFLCNNNVAPYYQYISYSQKDLDKQKLVVDTPPNCRAIYLYNSWSEVSEGRFPFTLSPQQYELAKLILTTEEDYVNKGEPQVEALLFIVGTPDFNNFYIQSSNLCFINFDENNNPVKNGLMKSNINEYGVQTYMLRLCIRTDSNGNPCERRNKLVLNHFNY